MPVSDTCSTVLYQMPDEKIAAKAALLAAFDAAQHRYRGMHFGFSDPDVLAALERMLTRGVDVLILIDYREFKGPSEYHALHPFLHLMTPARVRATCSEVKRLIFHDKVSIIDSRVCIDGSTNLTRPGWDEVNQMRITESAILGAAYEQHFDEYWQFAATHEQPYQSAIATDAA